MNHVSEQDFAFFATAAELPAEVREHLAACPSCRATLESFRSTIELVSRSERLPELPDSYGRDAWRRVAAELSRKTPRTWPAFLAPRRLAFAGIFALVLAATFLAGRFWRVDQPAPLSAGVRERILIVALGEHLERSQSVLIELANAPADSALDVTSEQARAKDLVVANRLYRQTASQSGDRAVASVLEELERLLLDVAHGPSQLSPEDLATLRQRIESKGVLFKVRVIGSNMRERGELPAPGARERKRT
jgi:anti-sigma factor RsiW